MTECSQCGKCCQIIVFGAAYGGADWNEYYHKRGCKIVDGVGMVVPSPCPHLKQIKGPGIDKNGIKSGAIYSCDIYDTRPQLCRLSTQRKNLRFFKPEGCTDTESD